MARARILGRSMTNEGAVNSFGVCGGREGEKVGFKWQWTARCDADAMITHPAQCSQLHTRFS